MAVLIAAVLMTAVWLGALAVAERTKRQGNGAAQPTGIAAMNHLYGRRFLMMPFRLLLDRVGIWDRLQPFMSGLHSKLLILQGGRWTVESTRQYAAFTIGSGYGFALAGAWLAALSGERLVFAVGALVGVVFPAAKWRDVSKKVETRRQDIQLVLPELLDKLMLLIGAGETVQRALFKCAERRKGQSHPLYEELRRATEAVRNGESFAAAIEAFSRRCAVQEVSVFTTTLLLNSRRGGDRLALALKELSYALWEKRKSVARARGEEASSKLVFPLVGVFLVLMVLVASPAILLLGK
ncbi:type II secretion system F family protein [Paenibacillus humicola]|uniref:type II secretion system F family protein n=1 Tax=Paenibacillus humicola TaxID=3110540 RepID=UPI00237A6C31|nr:type II secretion system F family protein [Paenibacillus humicola]